MKLSFVYSHTGERIKKIRPDGAMTYSIGGLYEVQKKPDGSEVHTKYFTGIKGDRIAQVTKDSSTVTLASVTTTSTEIYAAVGRGSFMTAMHQLDSGISYLMARHTSTGHISLFLLVIVGALGMIIILGRGPNTFSFWRRAVAIPSLVCFLTVVFIDCSGSSPTDNGTPWETTTGSTAGIPDISITSPTYNDTTLAGMPITGTFFIVANHLGSTAFVIDSTGNNIISEMYYEPYGEIVASASSGPDIIRRTYTGQIRDAETSLMLHGARYYDPYLGRFLTADTVVPGDADSQSYNRYMYVKGNPLVFADISGHAPAAAIGAWLLGVVIKLVVSAVIGGLVAGTVAYVGAGIANGGNFRAVNGSVFLKGFAVGAAIGMATAGSAMLGQWAASYMQTEFGRIFVENLVTRSLSGSLSGGINASFSGKNIWAGLGGGALTGGVGGVFSGVSNGLGNFPWGSPSFAIDAAGNVASNAVAKSMGFSSKTHADAFAEGFAGGGLRMMARQISAVYSGAEFGRSQYNTVGIAHRSTDIYKALDKDPDKNFIPLTYRSISDRAGGSIGRWHEGRDFSEASGLALNSTSQIHDGFNALVSSTGNPELSNGFYNVATMLPSYAAAQNLDQSSFWNNYEAYR